MIKDQCTIQHTMIILYIILIPKVKKKIHKASRLKIHVTLEINEDLQNENKQAIYSEFAIARDSATITWICQSLKCR